MEIINGAYDYGGWSNCFVTQAGSIGFLPEQWDMIIAHPPCTYLSCAGAQRTFPQARVPDPIRYAKGEEAARFFMAIWNARCPRIAVENPLPMKCFGLPRYSQVIHPYMFGDPWYKRTCIWLRGLPPLVQTEAQIEPTGYWVQRSGQRARGFKGGGTETLRCAAKLSLVLPEQWRSNGPDFVRRV